MFSKFQYFHNYYSSSFDFIFFVIFRTALVNIVLILAPWTAKGGVGPAAQEHLLAVLAQAQGLVTVHQHEAEHHLDTQQQRMEIPVNGGLIQQLELHLLFHAGEIGLSACSGLIQKRSNTIAGYKQRNYNNSIHQMR